MAESHSTPSVPADYNGLFGGKFESIHSDMETDSKSRHGPKQGQGMSSNICLSHLISLSTNQTSKKSKILDLKTDTFYWVILLRCRFFPFPSLVETIRWRHWNSFYFFMGSSYSRAFSPKQILSFWFSSNLLRILNFWRLLRGKLTFSSILFVKGPP